MYDFYGHCKITLAGNVISIVWCASYSDNNLSFEVLNYYKFRNISEYHVIFMNIDILSEQSKLLVEH